MAATDAEESDAAESDNMKRNCPKCKGFAVVLQDGFCAVCKQSTLPPTIIEPNEIALAYSLVAKYRKALYRIAHGESRKAVKIAEEALK